MKVLGSYEKARIYIEKQSTEDAEAQKRKMNPGPTITISRETGIGATAICEILINYFNSKAIENYDDWTYFDKELITKVMEDHNLPEHIKKFLSEEKPAQFSSWLREILGITPSKLSMLYKTSRTILKLAEYGNVIIVGRGANIITAKLPNTFHVRLVAPLNYRIENAMRLYNLERKNAAEFIQEADDARKDYILNFFHRNIEDPLLYHLVINTNLLEAEEIADMIGGWVIRKFKNFFKPAI